MSLTIRLMQPDDIPLGMYLKEQAGWNQTPRDWQRFLTLEPTGCLVAEYSGHAVGTTVALCFGDTAWLAMVLVEQSYRRRGIGRALVEHALKYLASRKVRTIRLDATDLGRPLYEQFGFSTEYTITRFAGTPKLLETPYELSVRQAVFSDYTAVSALDALVTRTDRSRLIAEWWRDDQIAKYVATQNNQIAAYAFLRPGAKAYQLGPVIGVADLGLMFLAQVMGLAAGKPIYIDIPDYQIAARDMAQNLGCRAERSFHRMWLGQAPQEMRSLLWASSGPECG
ncbi:MAG: GNAT family N-acetyltransferase [Gemmatales bacterium]|nr:GNAT family N-acetyltransferase [Gemmatales bacterium]MDW7993137.1 GNAT family N-acetyltransferase [Gemmatales bacterium]